MNVSSMLLESNIAFGTSGARGLVADFTPQVCAAFTQSFVQSLYRQYAFTKVAVAIDNRPSSLDMAAACCGMLTALGLTVDYYGVIPTPALAYQAMLDKVPAIMITGSHIPFDRNGIKFYRPDGEITKNDELAILSLRQPLLPFAPELPPVNDAAAKAYINRYVQLYPPMLLADKHIGIYEHSSAGREIYYQVFEALGARVTRLERSDVFVPIDTEAVSDADKARGKAWADQFGFDAIFSTDGDGDRPLLADEQGNWLRGDIVGLLCAQALGIDALAMPVNCNTAAEKCGVFSRIMRTRIGSPYVIAAFAELNDYQAIAGYEANGGFLLGSTIKVGGKALHALPTRDALLPALAVLALAGELPLSALINTLPQRFTASDRLQQVPVTWSKALIANITHNPAAFIANLLISAAITAIDTTDGLRLTLDNDDIIHLRPSGNAPELRCYAEAQSQAAAEGLVRMVLAYISQHALN